MSRNCIKSILHIWNLNLEVSERKCGFIGGTKEDGDLLILNHIDLRF